MIVSCIVSRVVPWMSLTIAVSSPVSVLSSDDFPALVGPTIATGMPSFIACPVANDWWSRLTREWMSVASCLMVVRSANCTSWSEKSSSSSSSAERCRSWSWSCLMMLEKSPRSWDMARRWAERELAAIMSATASARTRSIRPRVKARRVNSPGLARRAPALMSELMSCCWMYREP